MAIQKIEVNKYFKPAGWTYCFSTLSDQRVEVKWPNVNQVYTSREPVSLHPFPNAPEPTGKDRWALQARALSRQFSASQGPSARIEELRLIPQPITQYESKSNGILTGFVYAFATGTNPSIFVIIELREVDGKQVWHHGSSRATANAIRLKHLETELLAEASERRPGQFPTWTYLWMGAQ